MDATRHADDDDDDDDDETVSLTRKEAHDETEVQADTSAAAGNHTASYKSMSINCRRSTKVALFAFHATPALPQQLPAFHDDLV